MSDAAPPPSPFARLLLALIALYRVTLSPLVGRHCRHEPSCSGFGQGAISAHGGWRGGWMTLARLIRCRPGGSWGYDPVPETAPRAPFYKPWLYGDWRGGYRAPPEGDAAAPPPPRPEKP